LRDVSRSFYLSLRLLPSAMRPACGLGYLLARLSDTVADAAQAPLPQRQSWLQALRDAYLHDGPAPDLSTALDRWISHPGERVLIQRTADCLAALRAIDAPSREALREVLDAITRGQRLDLAHFGAASPETPRRLPSEDAVFAYADDVAGCVGRFWTRIALQADPQFASAPLNVMLAWGTRYGRALQWINIVRDLHEDLPRGRSYVDPEAAGTWLNRAEAGLRDGLRYVSKLRGRRLRMATVLPAMIGAATIQKLRESDRDFLRLRIKISRQEAGAIVRGVLWRVALNRPLEAYFESLLQPNAANSGGTGASKASGTSVTG